MTNVAKNIVISTLALIGVALSVNVQTGAAAKAKVDINAIVRQFHINYSNNQIDKNGLLVDEKIIGTANGYSYAGRKQFVEWLKSGKVSFPDGTISDQDVLVVGNTAAIRYTFKGTHTGPLQTPDGMLPATGKKISSSGAEFFTFNSDGKLIHLETIEDNLTVLQQLK